MHGVCTVAYTIFLFQRKMTNFDFHTFVDYLVTKMTKQSIQIKLLSQFSNEKTQYNITWLSCKLYSLFLCKSHYVHFPHILFQNVVELLSQLNKIRIVEGSSKRGPHVRAMGLQAAPSNFVNVTSSLLVIKTSDAVVNLRN